MKLQYENLTIRQAEIFDAKQLAAWWNDGALILGRTNLDSFDRRSIMS